MWSNSVCAKCKALSNIFITYTFWAFWNDIKENQSNSSWLPRYGVIYVNSLCANEPDQASLCVYFFVVRRLFWNLLQRYFVAGPFRPYQFEWPSPKVTVTVTGADWKTGKTQTLAFSQTQLPVLSWNFVQRYFVVRPFRWHQFLWPSFQVGLVTLTFDQSHLYMHALKR